MKVVLRDKFRTLSYVKNLEGAHASNLTAYLKDLEQRNQTLWSRWQETNSELKSVKQKQKQQSNTKTQWNRVASLRKKNK